MGKRGLAQHWIDRRKAILKMRADGMTLFDIGRRYGVTRERIRQVLKLYEHHYKEGGK